MCLYRLLHFGLDACKPRWMHFIYLDESGDPGPVNSPTKHYILAGFSVHHGDWPALEVRLRRFRTKMFERFGYPADAELHASELLGASPSLHGVSRSDRLQIARQLIYILSHSPEIRAFAWGANKTMDGAAEAVACRAMADLSVWTQEGRIGPRTPCTHAGFLVLHDAAPSQPFKRVPRPDGLVGHPVGLSSRHDNMIQVADIIAYLVRQKVAPNRHAMANGYVTLCDKLTPISLGWNWLG